MPPQQNSTSAMESTDPITDDTPGNPGFRVGYPSERDTLHKSATTWLSGKRQDDDIGDMWRVHDKLYDLVPFIPNHPGGKFWLEATKGTDVTEAFEAAHLNPAVEKLLPKFYVRDASVPRNSPYTFHDDGFYKTLKRKAWPVISRVGRGPSQWMLIIQDGSVVLFVALMLAAAYTKSFLVAVPAGFMLALVAMMAHNFFHQANNFRMYYFDLTLLSSADWRVTHAISHHLYTNTLYDFEISAFEPFLYFLPDPKKGYVAKFLLPVTIHLMMVIGFFVQALKRIVAVTTGREKLRWENILPVLELLVMVAVAGEVTTGIKLWVTMMCSSSTWFMYLGLIAAHHHPDIYHAHDRFRDNPDWGLCQLDAVRDKVEVTGSLLLVATNFGDHTLHHLFPTIDHSKLPHLYPALLETCREFGINFTFVRVSYLWAGMYKQMFCSSPNTQAPGYKEGVEVVIPKSVLQEVDAAKRSKQN